VFSGIHYAFSILQSSQSLSNRSFPPTADPSPDSLHIHACPIIIAIIIIILGLGSTNDREHVIFDLLSLAYLSQHDDHKFYLFS
jgi:hypothetical protein